MKVLLISMPDAAPLILHEMAIHMPNLGIASVAGNIDPPHEVHTIDLIRKRRNVGRYLRRTLPRLEPDLVGLSAMSWQYDTCVRIIRLIRSLLPNVKIAVGGYHATLMHDRIAAGPEARDIDFLIRGEGEETFRRLVNALSGGDDPADIPSLSWRNGDGFVHNERGDLLDLSKVRLPVRDRRRLTGGYHLMYNKIEVMETSRGCTRNCNFCSIRHMYGRSFRTYPIDRVLADLDDIYYKRRTRWVFITDDNLVLDPDRAIALSAAIVEKGYPNLNLVVQADCVSVARHPEMTRMLAAAGVKCVFLGIENVSKRNLAQANKGDIVGFARGAVDLCHQYGIMALAGLVLGFPDDDEADLVENYRFLNELGVDAAYCQILTPYPRTRIRESLMAAGLVTNPEDYRWYNGMWANVRTRHLDAAELQYLYWYHKQTVLGWWNPSGFARKDGRAWTAIWRYLFKPALKYHIDRKMRKKGWRGRYDDEVRRLKKINRFPDLDSDE